MNRNLDNVGRLVLPVEMRKELDINNGDLVNIECVGDRIIVTKPKKSDRIEEAINFIKENLNDEVGSKLLSILEREGNK